MNELRFVRLGFGEDAVEYQEAWDEQRRVHAARFADEIPDTCLLLEHPPVYTAGQRTEDSERPLDGTPVIDVDRGGKITWHGPGQLVGYPIVKLPDPVDVVALRAPARGGADPCRRRLRRGDHPGRGPQRGLGARRPGGAAPESSAASPSTSTAPDAMSFDARLDGPEYAPSNAGQRREDRKLAAIGIRVAKGVTMHGFSFNVNPDNTWFDRIVPCGIRDAGVTSLSYELGREVTIAEVLPVAEKHLRDILENAEPLRGSSRPPPPERTAGECPCVPQGYLRREPHPTYANNGRTLGSPKNRSHREPDVSAVAPEGRKLLRLEVRNARPPSSASPSGSRPGRGWAREYTELQQLVKSEGLHTVCQEAGCPNIFECWEDREATFLIGGDQCTRRCDFCQIDTGKPEPLDRDEPRRVARVGAARWACATPPSPASPATTCPTAARGCTPRRCAQIHELDPEHRRRDPDPRLQRATPSSSTRSSRPPRGARAQRRDGAADLQADPPGLPLRALARRHHQARDSGLVTKSNLILGMGETREEVSQALRDLHEAGCELITITQYLRPSLRHHPVERWVKPRGVRRAGGRGRARSASPA